MDKINYAFENFKNLQDLIKFIDQKANFLLAVYAVLFTTFVSFAKDLNFINPFSAYSGYKALFSLSVLLSGLAFIGYTGWQIYLILFKIIKPRKAENYGITDDSNFYYEHITGKTKEAFMTSISFTANDDEKIFKEISSQIYEVARILKKKQDNFNKVVVHLGCSIVILTIYIILIIALK